MQIVRTGEELAAAVGRWGRAEPLALVPTMGALHEGHLSLVRDGARRAARVAASIFVNPLQFAANEDLGRYPRREAEDAAMLASAGCDLLWAPAVEDIYPPGFATRIRVDGVSSRWEGEARPGHFDGVATVVARLLTAVQPDIALFGDKDFQQLAVIRRMVADLNLPVRIVGLPIVRDSDGLALSSRNAYLSVEERSRALALPEALRDAAASIGGGQAIGSALAQAKRRLVEAGFLKIDYVALVDPDSLEPLDRTVPGARLIAAATIGTTRLIDNRAVDMVESR